jgi:arginase family enzyme
VPVTESPAAPTYHLLGVPLRTGSLYPGTENDAQAYRDARIVERLHAAGCRVIDEGDVAIPSYLPHHQVPPIKNWPGPRIAWDCIGERITPYLKIGHVPLLIGADCSAVVGSVQALMRAHGGDVHVLYVDGDIDGIAPQADRCMSAAGMALWLATQTSPFRSGPALDPSRVTVLGWSDDLRSPPLGLRSVPLAEVRRLGPREAARQALAAIAPSTAILLHLDIDVLSRHAMPAAYFPHADGLTLAECRELLAPVLADARVRAIEIAEYASLRDLDGTHVGSLIDLLGAGLARPGGARPS